MRLIPTTVLTLSAALVACDAGPDAHDPAVESSALTWTTRHDLATTAITKDLVGKRIYRFDVDGLERETIVYLPRSARGRAPLPVVFMLHGTSGDGERFYNISGWREKADEEGFIAVFPTALHHCHHKDENRDGDFDDQGERKVVTKWAAGKLGDPDVMPLCTQEVIDSLPPRRRALADHPLADDIAYFDRMLDLLEDNYPIDVRRVYVSGFSNGAGMSSFLALQMPDRFAAAHAAGGSLWPEPVQTEPQIPMVLSLGDRDSKFTDGYGVDAFDVGEDFFHHPPGPAVFVNMVHEYLVLCGVTAEYTYSERTIEGRTIADFAFSTPVSGAGDNEFHFVLIEGLGHQYPNGKNHPLRLADPLWRFFGSKSL